MKLSLREKRREVEVSSSGVFRCMSLYNISAHTVGPFVKDGAFKEENGTDRHSRKGGK